jgi:hypothetical protein
MPNGDVFKNTDDHWNWLQGVSKAARWLGYVSFENIKDERNAGPLVFELEPYEEPRVSVSYGIRAEFTGSLQPRAYVSDFFDSQPYRIVLIGEKSSLAEVLRPLAYKYRASLVLPTGEISDTLLYGIARDAVEDGRPLAVLYFSDCDPAGHEMPANAARKLQALRDFKFPDLEFEVHQAALTVEQAKLYGLPSTPLKASERRADRWRDAMGVEQTEIDALAVLRPELFKQLAEEAIAPFFDETLFNRVRQAETEYRNEAQALIDDSLDPDWLAGLATRHDEALAEMNKIIDALNSEVFVAVHNAGIEFPEPSVPEAILPPSPERPPLFSTKYDWIKATRRLVKHKSYGLV